MNEANTMADILGAAAFPPDPAAPLPVPVPAISVSEKQERLLDELRAVLNRHSCESLSNTPDFLLASYLNDCLNAYGKAVAARDQWFGIKPWGATVPKSAQGFDPNGEG